MISDANLDFWIKNGYNVIFRGKHGVGKTATILEAFNRHNLKWQYFSASTMDPWVDFIGVPKEKTDENGNSYLDLVRPKHFQDDQVEAIFLDEFNRSSKKVRNAVMELIQFKSINGKKFNNLKIVWAAINPEDDEENKYDVEALDPAQLDRFHVVVDVPYAVHVPYFRKKYGAVLADAAVTWWKELDKVQKELVSPRRLDYAVDVYAKGGDVKFVLPNNVNVSKLLLELSSGSISKKLKELFDNKDEAQSKTFLSVENNFAVSSSYILKNKSYQPFFLPLLPEEKLVGLMSKDKNIANFIFKDYNKYKDIIENLATSKSSNLSKQANNIVKANNKNVQLVKGGTSTIANNQLKSNVKFHHNNISTNIFLSNYISDNIGRPQRTTYDRRSIYFWYKDNLPKDLDDQAASMAIKDMTAIVKSSQVNYTLSHMPLLVGMINYVIQYFVSNNKAIPLNKHEISILQKKLTGLII